jgi:hypothetical protein
MKLHLDFYKPHATFNQGLLSFILIILLLILVGLHITYLTFQKKINAIEVKQNQELSLHQMKPVSIETEHRLRETQQALNLPWFSLLTSLEKINSNNPDVYLLSLETDPTKKEFVITGESSNMASLVAYMDSFRKESFFSDVVLNNQHLYELGNQNSKWVFTLLVKWK